MVHLINLECQYVQGDRMLFMQYATPGLCMWLVVAWHAVNGLVLVASGRLVSATS